MKCGNSIVQQEHIRKVYVNGRLDHEESDGIGLCVYEKPGGGRVMTSWPKREKVLLINDVPFCYIGRTVANTPICWTVNEERDADKLIGIGVDMEYEYRSRYDSQYLWLVPVSLTARMESNPVLRHNYSLIGVAPDHLSARMMQKDSLDFDIYLSGRWQATETDFNMRTDGTREGSPIVTTGTASLNVKVARLAVGGLNGGIDAKATPYEKYVREDAYSYGPMVANADVTVSGVTCEVKDCEEE